MLVEDGDATEVDTVLGEGGEGGALLVETTSLVDVDDGRGAAEVGGGAGFAVDGDDGGGDEGAALLVEAGGTSLVVVGGEEATVLPIVEGADELVVDGTEVAKEIGGEGIGEADDALTELDVVGGVNDTLEVVVVEGSADVVGAAGSVVNVLS